MARQRRQYHLIKGINNYESGAMYSTFMVCEDIAAARCLGLRQRHGKTQPRMQKHKFFVFCDLNDSDTYRFEWPKAVWTGSFNATKNGANSLENALIIRNEGVAATYFLEWHRLLGLSEPLDWTREYVAPEYRIGT